MRAAPAPAPGPAAAQVPAELSTRSHCLRRAPDEGPSSVLNRASASARPPGTEPQAGLGQGPSLSLRECYSRVPVPVGAAQCPPAQTLLGVAYDSDPGQTPLWSPEATLPVLPLPPYLCPPSSTTHLRAQPPRRMTGAVHPPARCPCRSQVRQAWPGAGTQGRLLAAQRSPVAGSEVSSPVGDRPAGSLVCQHSRRLLVLLEGTMEAEAGQRKLGPPGEGAARTGC